MSVIFSPVESEFGVILSWGLEQQVSGIWRVGLLYVKTLITHNSSVKSCEECSSGERLAVGLQNTAVVENNTIRG